MEFIKNNWVLLLILVIIIYLVYNYYKKTKSNQITAESNNVFTQVKNFVTSKNETTTKGNDVVADTNNYNVNTFSINDKIYAGELTNTYKSPSISQNTLSKTYNKGDLIGTYIKNDGKFIQVLANEGSLGINARFIQILNNKVYKK